MKSRGNVIAKYKNHFLKLYIFLREFFIKTTKTTKVIVRNESNKPDLEPEYIIVDRKVKITSIKNILTGDFVKLNLFSLIFLKVIVSAQDKDNKTKDDQ